MYTFYFELRVCLEMLYETHKMWTIADMVMIQNVDILSDI
jgi:hypothetical protein